MYARDWGIDWWTDRPTVTCSQNRINDTVACLWMKRGEKGWGKNGEEASWKSQRITRDRIIPNPNPNPNPQVSKPTSMTHREHSIVVTAVFISFRWAPVFFRFSTDRFISQVAFPKFQPKGIWFPAVGRCLCSCSLPQQIWKSTL